MSIDNHQKDRVELQRQAYLDSQVPVSISLVEHDGSWVWVASVQDNPEFLLFLEDTQQAIIDQCVKYQLPYEIN